MTKKKTGKGKFDHLYQKADRYCILNEGDPDLDEIRVKLPKQPAFEDIEGYGLPPSEQKWKVPEFPPRLKELNDRRYSDVQEYWDELAEHFDYYKDEMPFVDEMWRRRREGHWVFIHGKATYIPPWHFFYLFAFEMDNEGTGDRYADYRDRDRKFFIGCHYAASTTDGYFRHKITPTDDEPFYTSSPSRVREAKAKNWQIESAGYLVDMKRRAIIGLNYPKLRREGATTKTQSINLEIITRMPDANTGIQSMTETHARTVYEKFLLKGWRGLPFFYIPVNEGLIAPTKALKMQPKGREKLDNISQKGLKPLYSSVNPGPSTLKHFDTWKLKFYHADETGKTEEVNVYDRHYIVKKTMTLGSDVNIVGFGLNTSTVEDMEEGGANFQALCKDSHWRDRDDTGQTLSGYMNFFIPSDEGLEGFVDEFGNSMRKEARAHLLAKRRKFEDEGKSEELIKEIRKAPLTFRECFTFVAKNKKFDIVAINDRLSEFAFVDQNPAVVRGKLEWAGWRPLDNYDIKNLPTVEDVASRRVYVRFVQAGPLDNDWDWEFSYIPEKEANRFVYNSYDNTIHPANTGLFRFGIDMFRFGEQTTSGKGSLGAGAIYRNFNAAIDNPLLPLEQAYSKGQDGDTVWKTDRFCGVYLKRPDDKNEFCEQMLMAAVLFGVPAFPEINVPDVWDWFGRDRRFWGYLLHKVDRVSGRVDNRPGASTGPAIKQQIFNAWAAYIKKNARREHHLVFLHQCKDIIDSMNDFDAFVAGGYALIQENELFFGQNADEDEMISSLSNVVRKHEVR